MEMITLLEHNVAFWRVDTYMVLTTKPLDGFKCQWHPCESHIGPEFATKRGSGRHPGPIGSTALVPRPGPRFMNLRGELTNGKGLTLQLSEAVFRHFGFFALSKL